jgi:hypothetical protein
VEVCDGKRSTRSKQGMKKSEKGSGVLTNISRHLITETLTKEHKRISRNFGLLLRRSLLNNPEVSIKNWIAAKAYINISRMIFLGLYFKISLNCCFPLGGEIVTCNAKKYTIKYFLSLSATLRKTAQTITVLPEVKTSLMLFQTLQN